MRAFPTVAILAALAAACGVPEEKYKAAVSESQRNMKEAGDQKQRADTAEAHAKDADAKAADLSQRLSDLEAKSAAAAAEAETQRQRAETLQAKSKEYESLAASLDKEIKAGQIKVSELQGKVTVRMGEKVLFPSGSATISPEGKGTLKKISEAFAAVKDRMIRVEGHTDNIPIHSSRFPSNWELSSARAISVVRYLQDQGMDPKLLGAAGYGEFQPISPNDTPDGRAENRRIEISLAAPL
jgi:chemotaxis protein MotB